MNTNNSTFEQKLDSFDEKILGLSNKFDSYGVAGSPLKDRRLRMMVDFLVLFLYIGLLSFVTYFHEPWGDEGQSWAIAKYASYKDMFFLLGHGEGHPPLWWIYLSIFAKSGLSFEFGLKIAAIILNTVFAYLLIFRVKIPRIMKYLVPFTYFFFYQYGVISRCYSILIIAMVLLSMVWNNKEKKPFKTVCALILLCLSSAYGIAISFALAALWTLEICLYIIKMGNGAKEKGKEAGINIQKTSVFKKRSTLKNEIIALSILLICAVIIVALIFPTNNPYALRTEKYNSYAFRLFYMLMLEPIDSLFYMAEYVDTELYKYLPDMYSMIIGVFVSIIFYLVILFHPKSSGKRRYLLLPHFIFSIVASLSFFWSHHMGVTTALFLFWFIICYNSDAGLVVKEEKAQGNRKENVEEKTNYNNSNNSNNNNYKKDNVEKNVEKNQDNKCKNIFTKIKNCFVIAQTWMNSDEARPLVKTMWVVPVLIAITSVLWTANSAILDIQKNYCADRELYKKIKELNLTDLKILSHELGLAVSYAGDDNYIYKIHLRGKEYPFAINNLTDEETDEYFSYWAFEVGWPDIFVGDVNTKAFDRMLEINPDLGKPPSYTIIYKIENGMIFKGEYAGVEGYTENSVSIRNDLLESINETDKEKSDEN
ncbi:MAG: hypothetical protein K6F97_12545 [Lachnospiraceae bacterium]|nr:hypothetical protein [Lachnospiraceae bacterium]